MNQDKRYLDADHKVDIDAEQDKEAGFTLIEMLVVMVIMALLIGVVSVNVIDRIKQGNKVRVESDTRNIATAMELYRLDNFDYPDEAQGIQALVTPPAGSNAAGSYLQKLPTDPWGNAYIYRYPGEQAAYDIISYGADGAPGGEGQNTDIINGSQ